MEEEAELIIVVDGHTSAVNESELQTLREAVPMLQVIKYEVNRGKGFALRTGAARAKGERIIYTDIDFPYTPGSFRAVYELLRQDRADVAVGVKNDDYYRSVPRVRRAVSRCLRFAIGVFFSMPVTDTQCGLKGFNRKALPLFLNTTIDRYLFDLEFIRSCYKSREKIRVSPVQIQLNNNVHFRRMNYRILSSEALNFLKLVLKS